MRNASCLYIVICILRAFVNAFFVKCCGTTVFMAQGDIVIALKEWNFKFMKASSRIFMCISRGDFWGVVWGRFQQTQPIADDQPSMLY